MRSCVGCLGSWLPDGTVTGPQVMSSTHPCPMPTLLALPRLPGLRVRQGPGARPNLALTVPPSSSRWQAQEQLPEVVLQALRPILKWRQKRSPRPQRPPRLSLRVARVTAPAVEVAVTPHPDHQRASRRQVSLVLPVSKSITVESLRRASRVVQRSEGVAVLAPGVGASSVKGHHACTATATFVTSDLLAAPVRQ